MSTTTQSSSSNAKSNWTEQKTKLIAKFPVLTDADLNYETGKREEMMVKVQKKLGKTKDELSAIIEKL